MHVPATLVRGGTSKCWLFDESELPTVDGLEALLVNAYGAADPVHLDGVGGATPTTSKPPTRSTYPLWILATMKSSSTTSTLITPAPPRQAAGR